MKRRKFIASAGSGFAAIGASGCSTATKQAHKGPGFDIHPFVKAHPEAVFIQRTDIADKTDASAIRDIGKRLAQDLIVKIPDGGYPLSTKVIVKPNWTGASPKDGRPVVEKLGVNTDPNFIEGWIGGMRQAAPGAYFLRESGSPQFWKDMGYIDLAERAGVDLRDMSSTHLWDMGKSEFNFIDIPDGVVFRTAAYMRPVNEEGTILINIAKFKAHGMGITATIKNLQGLCPFRFKQFCTRYDQLFSLYEKPYHTYFNKGFEKHIEKLYEKHLADGIPRWDKPGENGGIWQEQWCQRMLDSYTVTRPALSILEGIYSQDGSGFGVGPHEPAGPYGITSRDYISNMVLFGCDPFRIDIMAHWLAGHEPGNFGLFHIGIERGFSDVLDPGDIPVYLWNDGQPSPVRLNDLKRTPLATYFLQRDYNGQREPRFHLCDEPFDYSAWKTGVRAGDRSPSMRALGVDRSGRTVLDLTLPERKEFYIDVVNKRGERLWRLMTDRFEPGSHQLVWDGFSSPGLYNFYIGGMEWDRKREIVIG